MNEPLYETMPRFCGVHTFHNVPFQKDLDKVDYAVVGIPFDTAAVNRCGSRFAPTMVRAEASFSNGMGWNTNLNVYAEGAEGTDYAEIDTEFGYTKPTMRMAVEALTTFYKSKTIPLVLGGGQICTLAELRAINKVYGKVALVHFTNDRSVTEHGDFIDDGNMLLQAEKENLIDLPHSIQLGVRGGYNNKAESTLFLEEGMTLLTAAAMHQMSLDEICDTIQKQVGDTPCILSLDMGFLDPAHAPGVDNPKAGGFTTYDIRTILRTIFVSLSVKSFDIVNLVPMFDSGELTTQAADGILTDVVSAIAKKKENGGLSL